MAVVLGGPIVVLVERSLHTPTGYGLDFYRALDSLHRGSTLFVSPLEAIGTSLRYAVIATLIAVVVGGCRGGGADPASRARPRCPRLAAPRRLRGDGRFRVPHRARRAAARPPHVVGARPDRAGVDRDPVRGARHDSRCCAPSTRTCGRRRRCSAHRPRGCGARSTCRSSPGPRSWRPDSRSPSRSASSAPRSSSCARRRRRCRSLIFRLLGQPGALNFGAAMAASVILMALTAVAILAIERFRVGSVGEF